jgi:DNA-binding winged helix-turn-helix (wHTH) protein/Flp pilus assembly protein TadD
MMLPSKSGRRSFGPFVLDLSSGELHKLGSKIRLHEQCFQVLAALLERPGEMVTRDELRHTLWSDDTYVDFESGLNNAVKRLRDALGDSANTSRYVETIKRRGYRFIAPVEVVPAEPSASSPDLPGKTNQAPHPQAGALLTSLRNLSSSQLGSVALVVVSAISLGWFATRKQSGVNQQTSIGASNVIAVRTVPGRPSNSSATYQAENPVNPAEPNHSAYEAYQQGRFFLERRTKEGIDRAIDYFQQSIQMDPSYAAPYAGLADCYSLVAATSVSAMPPQEAWPKARTAALKALELDETIAEAHASLALTKKNMDHDFTGAENEYRRAIELNPNYANAYLGYSLLLQDEGRTEEALGKAESAVQLEPVSALMQTNLARVLVRTKNYDQAIEHLKLAIELDPNHSNAHALLGSLYEQRGMLEEAISEQEIALALSPTSAQTMAYLAHAYALSGNLDEATKLLAKLKANRNDPDYLIASVCVALGHKDEALMWLARAIDEREPWLPRLRDDWYFDALRSDARFQGLLRQVDQGRIYN